MSVNSYNRLKNQQLIAFLRIDILYYHDQNEFSCSKTVICNFENNIEILEK